MYACTTRVHAYVRILLLQAGKRGAGAGSLISGAAAQVLKGGPRPLLVFNGG